MAAVLPPQAQAGTKQVRGFVQVFKANSQVHYVPREILPTPITLFLAGEDEPEHVIGNAPPSEIPRREGAWGWDQFSEESVEIHTVSGNHLTMMTEPYVQDLAKRLRACLNEVSDLRQSQQLKG
ncbi:MAG TPA: hypothetical protein VHJ19_03495 [Gammaproteobacteria bacterium]|nr:hypothetical protein [Gammaproteobacteria bacterium]